MIVDCQGPRRIIVTAMCHSVPAMLASAQRGGRPRAEIIKLVTTAGTRNYASAPRRLVTGRFRLAADGTESLPLRARPAPGYAAVTGKPEVSVGRYRGRKRAGHRHG